jgi:iron(III) transport system substrate-binding protein
MTLICEQRIDWPRRKAIALAAALSLLAVPVSLAGVSGSAHAQTLAEIANYSGPDREQKLIEGAKKEGTLNIYSSATVKDQKALTDAF